MAQGVVGMDFLVDKMEEVMGSGIAARAAVLDTLAARATSSCPPSNVSECNLQSLRRASGGSNAMCPGECTETLEVASTSACLPPYLYPPEDVRRANGPGPHQQGAVVHSDVWVRGLSRSINPCLALSLFGFLIIVLALVSLTCQVIVL